MVIDLAQEAVYQRLGIMRAKRMLLGKNPVGQQHEVASWAKVGSRVSTALVSLPAEARP